MRHFILAVLLLSAVMLVAGELKVSAWNDYNSDYDSYIFDPYTVHFPKSDEEIFIYFHGDTTAVKTKDNCYAVVGVLYMLELYEEYEQECESVYEQHYITDPITGERFVYAETCGVEPTFQGYIEFIKNKLGVD